MQLRLASSQTKFGVISCHLAQSTWLCSRLLGKLNKDIVGITTMVSLKYLMTLKSALPQMQSYFYYLSKMHQFLGWYLVFPVLDPHPVKEILFT